MLHHPSVHSPIHKLDIYPLFYIYKFNRFDSSCFNNWQRVEERKRNIPGPLHHASWLYDVYSGSFHRTGKKTNCTPAAVASVLLFFPLLGNQKQSALPSVFHLFFLAFVLRWKERRLPTVRGSKGELKLSKTIIHFFTGTTKKYSANLI